MICFFFFHCCLSHHSVVTASANTINVNINIGLSGSTEEDNTSIMVVATMTVEGKQKAIVIDDATFSVVMIRNWGEEMKLWQDVAVKYATIVYSQTWVTCHYAWFVWSVSCMNPPWALTPVISKQCMFSINNLLPIVAEEICLIHLRGLWMYLVLAFVVRVVTARTHMLSSKDSNSLSLQVRMSRRRISNRLAHQNQEEFF